MYFEFHSLSVFQRAVLSIAFWKSIKLVYNDEFHSSYCSTIVLLLIYALAEYSCASTVYFTRNRQKRFIPFHLVRFPKEGFLMCKSKHLFLLWLLLPVPLCLPYIFFLVLFASWYLCCNCIFLNCSAIFCKWDSKLPLNHVLLCPKIVVPGIVDLQI